MSLTIEDVTALIDARIAELNQQRQIVGHVIQMEPLAIALKTGQMYPADKAAGLELAINDRVIVDYADGHYVIIEKLESTGEETGPPAHVHAGLVPVGGCIVWPVATTEIPAEYAVCDGTGTVTINGVVYPRPDYRNRFIYGSATPGTTGGSSGHTHSPGTHEHFSGTLTTGETGTHNHGGSTGSGPADRRGTTETGTNNEGFASHSHNIVNSSPHSHGVTGSTGVQSYSVPVGTNDSGILPPYITAAWVQRIA